jgi:hypothetical protein
MDPHVEAFMNRKDGGPEMVDGLIETAGLPASEEEQDALAEDELVADAQIDPEPEDPDTVQALDDLTIPQLKELADAREIEYPSDIHKADLVELLASS